MIPVTIELQERCTCGRWRFDREVGAYVGNVATSPDDTPVRYLAIGGQCQSCGDNLGPTYAVDQDALQQSAG
jgi:hypothetical protein